MKYTKEDLLSELRRLESLCEGTPTASFMDEEGRITARTYQLRFGSWNNAVEEAGLNVNQRKKIDREELIQELERLSDSLNTDRITYKDISSESKYSVGPFYTVFGSLEEAFSEAGLEMRKFDGEENVNWKGGHGGYYGPSWEKQRDEARERDNKVCKACGSEKKINVHHIRPVRKWEVEEEHEKMNSLENLICLCRSCHGKLEGKWQDASPEEFARRGKKLI